MLPLLSSMTTIVMGWFSAGEERQRPDLAVFADLEVVAGQVGDEPAVVLVDGGIDGDRLGAAAEGWLLLVLAERPFFRLKAEATRTTRRASNRGISDVTPARSEDR